MLVANDISGKYVIAQEALTSGSYTCPVCQKKVYLKRGYFRVPHFAHQKNSICSNFSEGETSEHLQGKLELYEWIKNSGVSVQLEVFLPEICQRADILFNIKETAVAIEYQCSPISIEEISKRTKGYHSLGIVVIWIAGSKLAISGKLTALQRAIIGEVCKGSYYFYHFDSQEKQLRFYPLANGFDYSIDYDARHLIALSKREDKKILLEEYRLSLIKPKDVEKNLAKLQLMSRYKNKYYSDFFLLLYENRLTLDRLPVEVHQPLKNDWMIKTLSFEWKLRVMMWLKSFKKGIVLTKRLLYKNIDLFISTQQIKVYTCPNITGNYYEEAFDEFIIVLIKSNFLSSITSSKWLVNRNHTIFEWDKMGK